MLAFCKYRLQGASSFANILPRHAILFRMTGGKLPQNPHKVKDGIMIQVGTLNGLPVAVLKPSAVPTLKQLEADCLEYDQKYREKMQLAIPVKTRGKLTLEKWDVIKSRVSIIITDADTLVVNP